MRSWWWGAPVAVPVLLVIVAASCSDDDDVQSGLTLPPILTTTSTTTIPPSTTTPQRFYEIQEGDTLIEIADRFGVPMDDLMRLNAIPDENAIFAGQLIELPDPATLGSAPPSSPSATSAP
jgi:LysM repeat protein